MTRPIVSADRFSPSATQLNRWEQAGQRAANLPDGGILDQRPGQSPNEAIVKNTTGSTLARFSVLKITTPLISASTDADRYKSQLSFVGTLVDEDDEERIAIIQTQLQNNDADLYAIVAGVTHVRLTGPAGKKHATTVEGESTLEAADSGPCVILHDPGPGDSERIARVRIGGGSGSDENPYVGGPVLSAPCCSGCLKYGLNTTPVESAMNYTARDVPYFGNVPLSLVDDGTWESDTLSADLNGDGEDENYFMRLTISSTDIGGAVLELHSEEEEE